MEIASVPELNKVLNCLLDSFVILSDLLRNSGAGGKQLDTKNKFGDT